MTMVTVGIIWWLGALLPQAQGFLPRSRTTSTASCLPRSPSLRIARSIELLLASSSSSSSSASNPVTLDVQTTWTMRLVLQGVPTVQGRTIDRVLSIPVQFQEEPGYEPPQGTLQMLPETTTSLKFLKTYWKLSEDPNERKDGLWIWGLFKEPLYPYLLLQLQTDTLPLSALLEDDDTASDPSQLQIQNNNDLPKEKEKKDALAALFLYAQLRHQRDPDTGRVTLETGATLTVRLLETVPADPLGAATVQLYQEQPVGTISFFPPSS